MAFTASEKCCKWILRSAVNGNNPKRSYPWSPEANLTHVKLSAFYNPCTDLKQMLVYNKKGNVSYYGPKY